MLIKRINFSLKPYLLDSGCLQYSNPGLARLNVSEILITKFLRKLCFTPEFESSTLMRTEQRTVPKPRSLTPGKFFSSNIQKLKEWCPHSKHFFGAQLYRELIFRPVVIC